MNRNLAYGLLTAVLLSAPVSAQYNVVFGHGTAADGEWSVYALPQLRLLGVPASIPFYEPSNSVSTLVPWWRNALLDVMLDSSRSLLVGHSLGGIAARHAVAVKPAASVLTVGSGHGGVPLAGSVGSATTFVWTISGLVSNVNNLITYGAVFLLGAGEDFANTVVVMVDNMIWSATGYLIGIGHDYMVGTYPPDIHNLDVGAPFLQTLPSNLQNSIALRGTMVPGYQGGPLSLVMNPYVADETGMNIESAGGTVFSLSMSLAGLVDWESDWAWRSYWAALAGQELGFIMMNYSNIWCTAVHTGIFGVSQYCPGENDGFIPVSRQGFAGATLRALNGPPHTAQAWHSETILAVRDQVCSIVPQC